MADSKEQMDKNGEFQQNQEQSNESRKVFKPQEFRTNVYVNGEEVPFVPLSTSPEVHIRNIIAMDLRDDDVIITAYPKCGTHWTWEVTQMLLNQTTAHATKTKAHVMMEFAKVTSLDAQPSPRILNSHLFFVHLPKQIFEKKTKVIHVVRNPKDVLVSMFHHVRQFMDITWDQLLEDHMNPEVMGYVSSQFAYMVQFAKFQKENPSHPVKTVYYEDLKKNPTEVTKDLADFLCVPATEDFVREVVEACSFKTLKKADENRKKPEHVEQTLNKQDIFRKGEIADWKNQFTVAQNEKFDAFIESKAKDHPFTFTFE